MQLRFRILAAAVTLIAAGGSIIVFSSVEPLRWRAAVILRYMNGSMGDATLTEVMNMIRLKSQFFYLGNKTPDVMGFTSVVRSPFDTKEGIEAGAKIYRERCVACHGADAGGGHATALKQSARFKYGSSNWAIYRNVANGIAGTGMPSVGLSFDEAWQVVSFLKSISADRMSSSAFRKDANDMPDLLANFAGLPTEWLLEAGHDATEWRTYSRTYDGWRFSPLTQINTGNVGKLRLRWIRQLTTTTTEPRVQAAPIVVNGVMFITEPPNNVLALDASNGQVLWTYHHQIKEKLSLCCGEVNRGVAVLDDKVYIGTLDAHLVALDAKTGKVAWDVKLAEPKDGYSITSAPLAVGDMIITGMAGGEFGVRGFLHAADAKTGAMRWRFHTIPGPGESGHDSWSGDSWKTGGGPTWVTGSFDPNLNLIYWGVGNPWPDFNGDSRAGDNLYTNSVVALDAKTGKLAWYFQFTPHDEYDWDANQTPILASVKLSGIETPVLATANRNGFYYLLDRRNGRFIMGVPFVGLNWAQGLDKSGRPIRTPATRVTTGGVLVQPDGAGGTNWWPPAFNPELGLFFVHAIEASTIFSKSGEQNPKRKPYVMYLGSGSDTLHNQDIFVRALKISTGEKVWEYQSMNQGRGKRSGLLATAGGLVFGAATEKVFGLDATTGQELWSVGVGAEVWQGPISYSIGGQQMIVFISGRSVIAFSL
jgi:alcohol dehydrogenase (cytochrome c)